MKDSLQTALPPHGDTSHLIRQDLNNLLTLGRPGASSVRARLLANSNPKQIIGSLPADATPTQQDSAIQAVLPPRPTVRSTRPDTLELPGWQIPSDKTALSVRNIRYDENFFSASPYYHAEISIRAAGMDADPLPYLLRHDDWVTGILLCCFLIVMTIFANSKRFIKQRLQDFFFNRMNKEKLFSIETGREMRHAIFLYLQSGLLVSLLFFDYTQTTRELFMSPVSSHILLGVYVLICWTYLGFKQLSYMFVNWIFFDKERRTAWLKSYSFLVSAEGVLLFPIALITVFFNLPTHSMLLCLCLLLGFVRLLLFYKTFCIFFPNFHGFLHLILYFCTLEMLPICGLWQALTYTNDILL